MTYGDAVVGGVLVGLDDGLHGLQVEISDRDLDGVAVWSGRQKNKH